MIIEILNTYLTYLKLMSIEDVLKQRTVDTTSDIYESQVIGAAVLTNGYLKGYHVTDEPDKVIQDLKSEIDLTVINPTGDLGGGLYISSVPEYWHVRSAKRWDYLQNTTISQRTKLKECILHDPDYTYGSDYLTLSELNELHGYLDEYVKTGTVAYLMYASGQPFNVSITQKMTKYANLPAPSTPSMVKVQFTGKFLNIEGLYYNELILNAAKSWARTNNSKLLDTVYIQQLVNPWLRSLNYDGVFTKSGMSTNPEMVIWNQQSIQQFAINGW